MQEVFAVAERVLRIDKRLADRFLIAISGDGRQFSDQAVRRDFNLVGIVDIHRVLIEGRQGADNAAEDSHRVCIARETVVERFHVLVQHRVIANVFAKTFRLVASRQFAVNQQVSGFQKVAILGEDLDRVSAVPQHAVFAVEERDRTAGAAGVDVRFIERDRTGCGSQIADVDSDLPLGSDNHWQFDFLVFENQPSIF